MADTQTEGQPPTNGGTATAVGSGYPDEIVQLGDRLSGLTVKQAVDLKTYLKDQYGIEAAQGGVMIASTTAPTTITEKPEEKTTFDVILKEAGEKKINVIKEVRSLTGLGLKEAKDFVESPGKPIKEGATKEEAEAIKKRIEDAGGKVELK